jgi:hypothetical protein
MKILKKGNAFVAYRTEKGELGADFAEVGSEIGRISITTGRYTGGTGALVELGKKLREFLKPKDEKIEDEFLVEALVEVTDEDGEIIETIEVEVNVFADNSDDALIKAEQNIRDNNPQWEDFSIDCFI